MIGVSVPLDVVIVLSPWIALGVFWLLDGWGPCRGGGAAGFRAGAASACEGADDRVLRPGGAGV